MTRLNAWLALALFAVAAVWILTHTPPWYGKAGLVVAAYFLALQWLSQYHPRTARWIGSTTVLLAFEIVRAVLSVGGGRGRR